jgi:zinc transporter, ZIP family
MTLHTVTRIAGFNLTGQPALDTVRVARAAMGLLITGLGLVVFATEGVPLVWAAIQHILATPAQLQAVKLSAIAGAATGVGGMALLVMKKIDDKGLGLFIAIAGGMMAAAAAVSLFFPAVQTDGALVLALVSAAAGYGVMTILDQTLPHEHPVAGAEMAGVERTRMALLMTIAIALHNVPEGFAVGASMGNINGASGTAMSIGMQNIPEGLIVATALWSIGIHKAVAALAALATGLVEPVGAAIGVLVAETWPMGTPASMAFAAGAMAFVVCNEMIPESIKMTGKIKTIYSAGISTVLTAIALAWMGA